MASAGVVRSPAGAVHPAYEPVKRLLDVALSALLLAILSPLLILIAAAIRLESAGPALFVQERAGRNGVPFRLLKFRTMRTGVHAGPEGRVKVDAPLAPTDSAITPFGRMLRAFSLDELPQLVNVLRGDMSLVGPRPTIPEQAAAYSARERVRLSVPPGLTGLAQVRGRNALSWPERIELDLEYVSKRGLWTDLGIIARTPFVMLFRRGVYAGR